MFDSVVLEREQAGVLAESEGGALQTKFVGFDLKGPLRNAARQSRRWAALRRSQCQRGKCFLQSDVRWVVGRQAFWLQRRQQVLPDQVQLCLHIGVLTGDGNYRVLFREDDGVLSESAVASKTVMGAAPELITVALQPIVL